MGKLLRTQAEAFMHRTFLFEWPGQFSRTDQKMPGSPRLTRFPAGE